MAPIKKVFLYETKLLNRKVYIGEIIYRDSKSIRMRLVSGKVIKISYDEIMYIKDLGWKKIKRHQP